MDGDSKFLILVAVTDGKNFECPGDHDVVEDGDGENNQRKRSYVTYLEARFNGEVLVSDAIELRSSEPQLNTELAWELDRKSLHLFRIERTPIKLQCFIEDAERKVKKLVGYSVLDLRSAQDKNQTKFIWKPLLNSKYRGPSHMRPELLCSLQLIKSGEDHQADSAFKGATQNSPQKSYLSSLENVTAATAADLPFDNDLRVKISDGFHKIWDSKCATEEDCTAYFSLSLVFTTTSNLFKLIADRQRSQDSDAAYCFRFTLFGNTLRTGAFADLQSTAINEKINLKIAATDAKVLSTYFHLNPMLEVQFCDSDGRHVYGILTVSLRNLASGDRQQLGNSVLGEFKFLPTDDALFVEEPAPVVGLSIELKHMPSPEKKPPQASSAHQKKYGLSRSPFKGQNYDETHHFCMSIDLRSLNVTSESILPLKNFIIQYSYASLGYTKKVKTGHHSMNHQKESPVVVKNGFFAFNFASNHRRIMDTFTNVPLMLELVDQREKNALVGTSRINLSEVLKSRSDENKNVMSAKVPVYDVHSSKVAIIHVIMCLNDLGLTNGDSQMSFLSEPSYCVQENESSLSSEPVMKQVESLLVEAAVEVEVWKQKKINIFLEDLKKKEEEYLKCLAEDNTILIAEKLKELDKREESMKLHWKKLEEVEFGLMKREKFISEKEETLRLRLETLDQEIRSAIVDVKKSYESKLSAGRDSKSSSMEDGLQKKVCSIGRAPLSSNAREVSRSLREKSSPGTISFRGRNGLDRANSVPNSVRAASKQNGTIPVQVPNRRSESITRQQANGAAPKPNGVTSQPSSVVKPPANGSGEFRPRTIANARSSSVSRAPGSCERKATVLAKLQQEKNELIRKKFLPADDLLIQSIDAQLRRSGIVVHKH